MRILILGGTTEASALVESLGGRRDFDVVLSLAGRTTHPKRVDVETRIGGFGGEEGLRQWLADHRIDAVIDATHPFAAQMSRNAALACARADVPLLGLRRLAWRRTSADLWTEVETVADAVAALGVQPRNVFLTVGRLELGAFVAAPQHRYLVRTIEPIGDAFPVPHATDLRARGPFLEKDEGALMTAHGIDILVAKNSGGAATYGKMAAARRLAISVILIAQPEKPAGAIVHFVDEAMTWLQRLHGRTP